MSEDGTCLRTPPMIKGGSSFTSPTSRRGILLSYPSVFFGSSFSLTTLWRPLEELMKDVKDGILQLPLLVLLSTLQLSNFLFYCGILFAFPSSPSSPLSSSCFRALPSSLNLSVSSIYIPLDFLHVLPSSIRKHITRIPI